MTNQSKLGFKPLFFTLVGAALMLPVVMAASLNPGGVRFLSQASQKSDLTVWFEPSAQIATVGQAVTYVIMAEFDETADLLPRVELEIVGDTGLSIEPNRVVHGFGLRGKAKVGEITVKAEESGRKRIWVNELSVNTGMPDVPLNSIGAELIVKSP